MAKGFRPVVRDQPFLLPPDMREWLPEGHLAWFVIDAVAALDVSRFAARTTPAGSLAGRAAYDPAMLLALLVYGYARGIRSSRRIERACGEDVAFRVICAQDGPDHATIARFRRGHFADAEAMGQLFSEVLVLAARAGLGRLGYIALDGTKIAASASKDVNRSQGQLRKLAAQILAEAEAVDAAEDELFGEAGGDELPPELADPKTRAERIRRALAGLEAERRAAREQEDQRASDYLARPDAQRRGRVPRAAQVVAAQQALERETARYQAKAAARQARLAAARAAGRAGLPGPRLVPASEYCRVKAAAARLERALQAGQQAAGEKDRAQPQGPQRNITDPDSRLMPVRGGGFLQGFNAQAQHSADGLCLAVMVTADSTDFAAFTPMMTAAQTASDLLRAHARGPLHRRRAKIGIQLADAGYCSEANLASPGPDRLIATGKHRDLDKTATPANGHGGDLAAAMAARIASPPGRAAYRQRSPLAEGPFGHLKHNLGFRRFSLRGLARANGEWAFHNTVTNLLKIHATGWQPSPA